MDLAKPGLIKRFCNSNALLTFREFLDDYAPTNVREAGIKLIEQRVSEIEDANIQKNVREKLSKIASGERDIYI